MALMPNDCALAVATLGTETMEQVVRAGRVARVSHALLLLAALAPH